MDLDWRICSRARLARDARFDGKFFIGVLTTKIYCRPICRARTSKESNVRYFPSAAAAAEAGFRPCLRCRPECSPGTAAWAGTRNTVSRALRLISESGLEDGGVEHLAERLGISSRHLRRLFLRHLGATPKAVAQTRRLHFAKKLIDETKLPMTQLAIASGFGSVRRFNATIRKVYRRTPSQIRRLARQTGVRAENEYLFQLNFRPPYNWKRILEFLRAHAIPGVEAAESGTYARSISLNGIHGHFAVSLVEENEALNVLVQFGDPRSLFFIIERIRAMFDLNADWATIARTLRADPSLAPLVDAEPGLRVPGCWSGFELGTRTILGQGVSLEEGTGLAAQIARIFGQPFSAANYVFTRLFPTPEILVDGDLHGAGLPGEKAEAVRTFARAVRDGRVNFGGIVDTGDFVSRLRDIACIEESTAQYVVMHALGEPDAFPASDPALRQLTGTRTPEELEHRSQAWRPWRAYAAMLLWQSGKARILPGRDRLLNQPVRFGERSKAEAV
jgi:AraC family transcriptional regulator, regulatory protein of adaptative response / DNA-3-methyladenine glycosylase II